MSLREGNPPVIGELFAQKVSNMELQCVVVVIRSKLLKGQPVLSVICGIKRPTWCHWNARHSNIRNGNTVYLTKTNIAKNNISGSKNIPCAEITASWCISILWNLYRSIDDSRWIINHNSYCYYYFSCNPIEWYIFCFSIVLHISIPAMSQDRGLGKGMNDHRLCAMKIVIFVFWLLVCWYCVCGD